MMRAIAIVLLLAGLVGISCGLASCHRYNSGSKVVAPHDDADGDARPYLAFRNFFVVTAAGVVTFSVGAYLYSRGRRHKVKSG